MLPLDREPRLERRDRGKGRCTLRLEQWLRIEGRSIDQDQLEQEQRSHFTDVLDRLGQPVFERFRPGPVARKIVRFGPRSPGSLPIASISPRCSSNSSAR